MDINDDVDDVIITIKNDVSPLDEGNEEIIESYVNPFYVKFSGSDIRFQKYSDIKSNFNRLLIVCLNNIDCNNIDLAKIYSHDTTENELKQLSNYYCLISAPLTFINNDTIKNCLSIIGKRFVNYFNNNSSFELNNLELVYLIPNMKKIHIEKLLSLYESDISLNDYIENKLISVSMNIGNSNIIQNKLIKLMNQISDFTYWENEKNCNISN